VGERTHEFEERTNFEIRDIAVLARQEPLCQELAASPICGRVKALPQRQDRIRTVQVLGDTSLPPEQDYRADGHGPGRPGGDECKINDHGTFEPAHVFEAITRRTATSGRQEQRRLLLAKFGTRLTG
jgi:hypothetical protein